MSAEPNELETLFVRAFTNPATRPAFYLLLMRSEVLVFSVHGDPPPSIVAFPRDGGGLVVPIFTSENALLHDETMALDDPHAPCVSWVSFRTVLERVRGLYLHINPRSQFNRSFRPEEVAWLLTGEAERFFSAYASDRPTEGPDLQLTDTKVSIPELEEAFTHIFTDASDVDSAFLVEVEQDREGRCDRSLLMVVHAPFSMALADAVRVVFSKVYTKGPAVNVCFDKGDKGVLEKVLRIGARPFFARTDIEVKRP